MFQRSLPTKFQRLLTQVEQNNIREISVDDFYHYDFKKLGIKGLDNFLKPFFQKLSVNTSAHSLRIRSPFAESSKCWQALGPCLMLNQNIHTLEIVKIISTINLLELIRNCRGIINLTVDVSNLLDTNTFELQRLAEAVDQNKSLIYLKLRRISKDKMQFVKDTFKNNKTLSSLITCTGDGDSWEGDIYPIFENRKLPESKESDVKPEDILARCKLLFTATVTRFTDTPLTTYKSKRTSLLVKKANEASTIQAFQTALEAYQKSHSDRPRRAEFNLFNHQISIILNFIQQQSLKLAHITEVSSDQPKQAVIIDESFQMRKKIEDDLQQKYREFQQETTPHKVTLAYIALSKVYYSSVTILGFDKGIERLLSDYEEKLAAEQPVIKKEPSTSVIRASLPVTPIVPEPSSVKAKLHVAFNDDEIKDDKKMRAKSAFDQEYVAFGKACAKLDTSGFSRMFVIYKEYILSGHPEVENVSVALSNFAYEKFVEMKPELQFDLKNKPARPIHDAEKNIMVKQLAEAATDTLEDSYKKAFFTNLFSVASFDPISHLFMRIPMRDLEGNTRDLWLFYADYIGANNRLPPSEALVKIYPNNTLKEARRYLLDVLNPASREDPTVVRGPWDYRHQKKNNEVINNTEFDSFFDGLPPYRKSLFNFLLRDPVTREVMSNPVSLRNGYTYNDTTLSALLKKSPSHSAHCPYTGELFTAADITPCVLTKKLLQLLAKQMIAEKEAQFATPAGGPSFQPTIFISADASGGANTVMNADAKQAPSPIRLSEVKQRLLNATPPKVKAEVEDTLGISFSSNTRPG